MNKPLLTLLLFFSFYTALFATTDICDISIGPDSKAASFANGENVTVTMSYSTDEASGIRIYARPFTNGSLPPAYAASGSGLYTGAGTASSSFTITAGSPVVDEIRIEVYASDNTTLLRRMWVPVRFKFGSAGVNTFSFSQDPGLASFLLNESFTANFSYNVSYSGGVRIFIRPFSNGALTPGYAASGSGVYSGTGTSSANFTITAGKNIHVDALRVQVLSADQSVTVDEFFIPVNLYFSTVKITDIVPQSGNFPFNNDDREIAFNYATTEGAGVRIFPRPWTNGALTPNYAASGSPLYMGSGSASGKFTITTTDQRVDHVRFNVTSADQSETLLEMWSPVEYTFGNFLVEDIQLCPASPARMENGERINIRYAYYNDEGQNTRVFVRPFSSGALTPGYAASGSGVYAPGTGNIEDYFTITSGDVVVDQLRFRITDENQSAILAEYFIPVHYVFGNPLVAVFTPNDVVASMSVFPNPASDQAQVSISMRENGNMHVFLTDLSGRVIQDNGNRMVVAQVPESFRFECASLAGGVYFVVAEGAGFRHTQKLLIVK